MLTLGIILLDVIVGLFIFLVKATVALFPAVCGAWSLKGKKTVPEFMLSTVLILAFTVVYALLLSITIGEIFHDEIYYSDSATAVMTIIQMLPLLSFIPLIWQRIRAVGLRGILFALVIQLIFGRFIARFIFHFTITRNIFTGLMRLFNIYDGGIPLRIVIGFLILMLTPSFGMRSETKTTLQDQPAVAQIEMPRLEMDEEMIHSEIAPYV